MRKFYRAVVIPVVGAVLLLSSATVGTAATATLTGETFTWVGVEFNGFFSCQQRTPPSSSNISYEVSTFPGGGAATGPYPGNFIEDGNITFDSGTGVITAWEVEDFMVEDSSGNLTVTGTKHLPPGVGTASCTNLSATNPISTGQASAALAYDATINTTSPPTPDSGTSTVTLDFSTDGDSVTGSHFSETFGVLTPEQQLQALIGIVQGQQLGPAKSLATKLMEILASVQAGKTNTACNQLHAFEHEVAAQSGKFVAADNGLIAAAMQIEVALGC